MLFNSLIFLAFAAIFFILFTFIKKINRNIRWLFLTIASFVFYGWWDWRFLFLIIGSGLIDYFSGLAILKHPKNKFFFLLASLFGNIGSLMAFKYSSFIAENIEYLFSIFNLTINLKNDIPEFMLILPVGISFYTFQSMSYTIDIYKGKLKPTKNILQFFSYLAMFPQLVAGPIVRARDLLPQLNKVHHTTEYERWNGIKLIAIGYFKKVVMADNLAPMINEAFSSVEPSQSMLYWWIIIAAFAFQIYFDFSGYSDIARGLAKWMGFHFRINFNHPYISTSIREFWTRWHISLSTWFRDYVYIPLGGGRKGKAKWYFNMWITMVVSGFWHGASYNFIIWGGLHALYLSLERLTKWNSVIKRTTLGKYIALLIITIQVLVAWVFFRAENLSQSVSIVKKMFNFNFVRDFDTNQSFTTCLIYLFLGILIEFLFFIKFNPRKYLNSNFYRYFEIAYIALLITACIFLRGTGKEFIYFQF